MLKINLTKQAKKLLESLPKKQTLQIAHKIQELMINPHTQDRKKLKGYNYLRADIGEYRIIYNCLDDVLEILLIDKRNDDLVYKKLKHSS